jgi:hypothetical protein
MAAAVSLIHRKGAKTQSRRKGSVFSGWLQYKTFAAVLCVFAVEGFLKPFLESSRRGE